MNKYSIDDRGNRVDFHRDNGDGTWTRYAAILDRESSCFEYEWDGDIHATEFAKANGYRDEIDASRMPLVTREKRGLQKPYLWKPGFVRRQRGE